MLYKNCSKEVKDSSNFYKFYNFDFNFNKNSLVSPKKGLVILILYLILGHFSIYRFYVGKNNSAIAMLLSITFVGLIISIS